MGRFGGLGPRLRFGLGLVRRELQRVLAGRLGRLGTSLTLRVRMNTEGILAGFGGEVAAAGELLEVVAGAAGVAEHGPVVGGFENALAGHTQAGLH